MNTNFIGLLTGIMLVIACFSVYAAKSHLAEAHMHAGAAKTHTQLVDEPVVNISNQVMFLANYGD